MTNSPWLSVIGVGAEGLGGLSSSARVFLEQAEVVVGGKRHLAMLPETDSRVKLAWSSPLDATLNQIATHRGRPVCVLASGDPLFYGIGAQLVARFPLTEMVIIPAISSLALACSRLGWAWAEVEVVSLCGRPLELLNALLYPQARIIALSATALTPNQIAHLLTARGYGESWLYILENLGHAQEQIRKITARAWVEQDNPPDIAPLNLVGIECSSSVEDETMGLSLSRLAGLPDRAYSHDGQLTKQEVRAMTLAALAPMPGQLLWDVGAGCGSIGIEWLRAHPRCQAIAIERHPQRLTLIATNAANLGVPHLQIMAGAAPKVLESLPRPDAIFIGGGSHLAGMIETCWQALKPGGRLVVNAVTVASEHCILQWQHRIGGTLRRIAIQRAEPLGTYLAWRALTPVTQWQVIKASFRSVDDAR